MSKTPPPIPDKPAAPPNEGERIAKRLARAGLCSRRDAERWVEEGRVTVNGAVLTSPAINVGPRDRVTVDGRPLPQDEPTRVWRYHKPAGLVTTARDELGRATVFDHLPDDMPRVISIGRLDLNTEGLLLLTNDGALARHLELPATGWPRRYRVRVHGKPDEVKLAGLADGIFVDGIEYGPIEAVMDREQGANAWLTLTLREGKNREIRKVLEHLGLTVNRLIRLAYGPFQLGKLERGAVEEVPRRALREELPDFFPESEKVPGGASAQLARGLRFDRTPKGKGAAPRDPARTGGGTGGGAIEWARAAPVATKTYGATKTAVGPQGGRPKADTGSRGGPKADALSQGGLKATGGKAALAQPHRARGRSDAVDVTDAQAQARALARRMDRALGRDDDVDEEAPRTPPRRATPKPTGPKPTGSKPVTKGGKPQGTAPGGRRGPGQRERG